VGFGPPPSPRNRGVDVSVKEAAQALLDCIDKAGVSSQVGQREMRHLREEMAKKPKPKPAPAPVKAKATKKAAPKKAAKTKKKK